MYRFEQTTSGVDIVIDGWEAGISSSPYPTTNQSPYGVMQQTGLADMRNVSSTFIPGEVSVNFKTQTTTQGAISAVAFTVAASNDTFTYNGTVPIQIGAAIVLNTLVGGTGLATSTTYWVKTTPSATTFTVTAAAPTGTGGISGTTVNVTLDGSGTFSTINMGLMTQMVPDSPRTTYYGIDTNGRAWALPLSGPASSAIWVYLGNTPTASSTPDYNTGIAVWNNYIFLLYNGASGLGLYTGSGAASPVAFTLFKTLSNTATHRTYTDKNNTLYWCDGNQIGSLIELTTFNPSTSTTYTYSAAALLIQENDTAQCMTQLGSNLLIGGTGNQIYSWDRYSTGYTPIFLPDYNTHRMVTINSNAYIFAGNQGRIFVTNGANAQLFAGMPNHLSNTVQPNFTWGGADTSNNQLYFSVSAYTYATPATSLPYYGGIWAIDMDSNALRLVNQLSYGTYHGYAAEVVATQGLAGGYSTTVPSLTFGYLASWQDTTGANPNYGVDATGINSGPALTNVPYTNYESYVDSDMIPIGTYLNPITDSNVEFKLAVPIVAGEGVKLAYRQNLSQSFTDITNGEFTTAGTLSGVVKVSFQKSQWIQIRCYLKSTNTTPSYTRLKELRIRQ